MSVRLLGLLVFVLALAGAGFLYSQHRLPSLKIPDITVSTPGPLRGRTDAPVRTLTVEGILRETNRHRAENGLAALALNAKLSSAAQAKVNDMFHQQYFEHIGPDGRGPSDWVSSAGYDYIAVGENLALGNFDSDADLVQAWMNSPGHRANILNKGFKEIGLAATAGTFEDNRTWLAVQEFATPSSACVTPVPTLRTQYEQKEAELEQIQSEINATKATLGQLVATYERLVKEGNEKVKAGNEAARRGDREEAERLWAEGEALHAQAKEVETEIRQREAVYNDFINQYNARREELMTLSQQINTQISTYNTCVASLTS